MKLNILIYLILIFLFFNFSCASIHNLELNKNEIVLEKAEILKVMDMQENAWNNGDIDQFMEGYWKSDSLRFSGRNITYGWEATKSNYKKGYPDLEAMGKLEFEILNLDVISKDAAIMLGRYTLIRDSDKPTGLFTLVWRKINGNWVITSDMTCG